MFFHQSGNSQGHYSYNSNIYCTRRWFPHFHQNHELIYVFQGSLEAVIDGKRATLRPGEFAMCLSNQVHSFSPGEGSRYWIGGFSGDSVPEFDAAVQGKVGTDFRFRCEGSILDFLLEHIILERSQPVPEFHRLTAGLNLLCGAYLGSVELVERDDTEDTLTNDICGYIFSNFRSKLNLRDVATALGYDYYYFSRLFHRVFGVRFVDYLNACRCSAAANDLRDTDKNITDIALDSGFQSIRTFNDVFLKSMGISPAQYRKRHQKNGLP